MKVKKIFTGSWYPRTFLHLEELAFFLNEGKSRLPLDKNKLRVLRSELKPDQVKTGKSDDHAVLTARLGNYDFEYDENGLVLLSTTKESKDVAVAMAEIADFSLNKLFKSLSYLYSLGAPIPKIFAAIKSVMPHILVVEGGNKKEISDFFVSQKDGLIKVLKAGDSSVFYGKNIIAVEGDPESVIRLIRNIYLIHDIKVQFEKILSLHRFIWEEIDKIKASDKIRYHHLPLVRDTIMQINSEVIFFKSRLDQVGKILKQEAANLKLHAEKAGTGEIVSDLAQSFDSLIETHAYLVSLWQMTENYVSSTLNLITLLYAESSQKQLNILQFIFVISAVASIIAMGSVYGFDLSLSNELGNQVLQGESISFSLLDLFRFGGSAVLVGGILFVLFNYLYSRKASAKLTNKNLIENREFQRIKKMLGE
jgi:hypothetical protein